MQKTARFFKNGRSQAVRLPSSLRFSCSEVFIRKDPKTGDVILSRKPGSWDELFASADSVEIPADFLRERDRSFRQLRPRLRFASWSHRR